ncbi:MAG: hypothetical protein ACI36Y_05840, partial [Coriobacteriales bacterium]
MADSAAAASRAEEGKVVQGPRPGSPVDRILNGDCEGDELVAALKAEPTVCFGEIGIDFSDDLWDFTGITDANIPKHTLKIGFSDTPMKDAIKLYVLTRTLWERAKVQSLHSEVASLEELVRDLGLEPGNIRLLGADEVRGLIESYRKRISASSLASKLRALRLFLELYERMWGRLVDKEVLGFLEETIRVCNAIAKEIEGWPAIPADYLRPLMDTARSVMADEGARTRDRIIASVIILLERLGFRDGECLALEAGAIEVLPGPCGMPDIAQLSFRTWKGKRGNGVVAEGKTAVDALSLEAYLTLERICDPYRRKLGVSTLIVFPRQRNVFCGIAGARRALLLFLLGHRDSIPCVNSQGSFPELQTTAAADVVCENIKKEQVEKRAAKLAEHGLEEDDVLVYPVLHSFRVSFATRLYEGGYDFDVIAK